MQGRRTVLLFAAWVVFVGVGFGAAVLILLERAVLSRLMRLSAGVLAIGTGGDPRRRVSIEGRDQIAYLGAAINGLLDAQERSTGELRAIEKRNEAFLDAVPDVIFRITRDGTILDARSPARTALVEAADALVGKDTEELLSLYPFISPEQLERSIAATAEALDTGLPRVLEFHVDVEGGRRHYEQRFVPSGEHEVIALMRDVTAQKRAEEHQRKEILLKEIHHRVKNNLQVISSLLALQASAAPDAKTRDLLVESRDRVRSMALVHEKLYAEGDERRANFAEYARDLAAHLRHSYAGSSDAVRVEIDVEEVSLGLDVSVACGLIINELLSNAIKYAFPNGRRGTVFIGLKHGNGGSLVLSVRDDGIGFPGSVDFRAPSTLGLRIVNILAAQLKGVLALQSGSGSAFTLTFPG
jgi:two-component sensor histidine kinase